MSLKVGVQRTRRRWMIAALSVAAIVPLASLAAAPAGLAAVMPRHDTVRSPHAVVWQPVRRGTHVVFGTIVGLRGALLQIRLRRGQTMIIDATTALANHNYSAPLFVGKVVSIDGEQVAGKFTATHIFRMTNLNNLPADH